MSAEIRQLRGEVAEALARLDDALDRATAALEPAPATDAPAPTTASEISAEDQALIAELKVDEGVRRAAYKDSLGFLTIGCGRLVDERRGGGISDDEIDYLLANDLRRVDADLDRDAPWWRGLDPVRRRALRNLCFNMGWGGGGHGLSSFVNTLAALKAGDYAAAAAGFAASKWAGQVQASRSSRIIRQIATGA